MEPEKSTKNFYASGSKITAIPTRMKSCHGSRELIVELSARYIHLYETITGENFKFPDTNQSIQDRLNNNLQKYL